MSGPVAILRFLPDGELQLAIAGEGSVRFLVVDERCPRDRVYQITERVSVEEFHRMVPPGTRIGNKHDARHRALMARVAAARDGVPHLRRVK